MLALVGIAAGCGGDDESGENATAVWVSDFCTAVTDWKDELESVTSQFSDPSNLSEDALRTAAEDVRSATQQFADDVERLGAPETESGEEIRSALSSLSSTVDTESANIEETVQGVSNIAELPGAITAITTSMSAMATALSTAFTTIEGADIGDELQAAREDSPECDAVISSG